MTTWKGNAPNAPVMTVCSHMPDMLDELCRLVTVECKKAGVPDFYIKGIAGFGSFRSNSASAGTDNGAHIDLDFRGLSDAQRKIGEACARKIGFYADIRLPRWYSAWFGKWLTASWWPHCHMLPVGDSHLSSAARAQIAEWVAGENGLAGNDKDDGPRTFVGRTWAAYLAIKNAVVSIGGAVVAAAGGFNYGDVKMDMSKGIQASALRPDQHNAHVARLQSAIWNWRGMAFRKNLVASGQIKTRAALYDGVYGKVTVAMVGDSYKLLHQLEPHNGWLTDRQARGVDPLPTWPGPKFLRRIGFTNVY